MRRIAEGEYVPLITCKLLEHRLVAQNFNLIGFQYSILLIILLLLEVGLGVLTFILKDKGWIKSQATYGLRNFILHYREDPDQQNLIDYIQQQWECCGIDTPSGKKRVRAQADDIISAMF